MIAPVLVSFLLAAPGAAPHGHAPDDARRPLSFEMEDDVVAVPMNLQDGRIVLDVLVNGKGPFPMVLDTGAQGSVFDLALAQELGLALGDPARVGSPAGGGIEGRRVKIDRMGIAGLSVKAVPGVAFAKWPFPKSPKMPRGVLSPHGLEGLLVELDYPGKRVVFRRGALPEPDGREVFG